MTFPFGSQSICIFATKAPYNSLRIMSPCFAFFSRNFPLLPKCGTALFIDRTPAKYTCVRNAATKWQRSRNLYYKSECNHMQACRQVSAPEHRGRKNVRFISVVFQFSYRCERVSELLSCNFYSAKIGNRKRVNWRRGTKITSEI